MQQIIDCFIFNDEFDLLEIRLNSLKDQVDMFLLVEAGQTFSGNRKPCYFNESKDHFTQFNIRHILTPMLNGPDPWAREYFQRNLMECGLGGIEDDAIVLMSDVDEIPDLSTYNGEEGVFNQKFYYYYVNTCNNSPWGGTVATTKRKLLRGMVLDMKASPQRYRDVRNMLPVVGEGWHFSNLGTADNLAKKIESYSHQEFNTPEIKAQLVERMHGLVDYLGRSNQRFTIADPTGPQYLLRNKQKYSHLFYKEDNEKNPA